MRQILVPKRPHDADVCMQKKQQTPWGLLVHEEEKTIHWSNTLTRNRDSNKTLTGTLIGDRKKKDAWLGHDSKLGDKTDTAWTKYDWTRDLTGEWRTHTGEKKISKGRHTHWKDTSWLKLSTKDTSDKNPESNQERFTQNLPAGENAYIGENANTAKG